MKVAVGLDDLEGFDERLAAVETEPGAGMPMPLDVKAVVADPIQAREGVVEFLAEVLREAGQVALNEAVGTAAPLAADVDDIVGRGGVDGREESRLQHVIDEPLTGGRDPGFLRLRYSHGGPFRRQAAMCWRSPSGFQLHGNSSASRLAGCSAMRARTSASQACGSTPFILQEMIRLYMIAARWPPRSEPQKSHERRPRAMPLSARSAALLVRQIRPSSRKPENWGQRLSI